jgi:signal transduction histidine kinase
MSMNRALQFKSRLRNAGIVVLAVLFLAFSLAFRGLRQAETLNRWVGHTQQVLELIARVRLERARLSNYVWMYRSTHDSGLKDRFHSDARSVQNDLRQLRELTADNPTQQKLLAELTPLLSTQLLQLERALEPADASSPPSRATPADPSLLLPSEPIRLLFDDLDHNERALLATRSARVQANARATQIVLLAAGLLTFFILAVAGYLIQREILMRADIETGLRQARELLGMKYQEQTAELGHAIADLHTQIRARQQAEAATRALNQELEKRVQQRTTELQEMNSELESFSYSVSHDLRAPLRHMDGYSRFLQQEYGTQLPEEAQHYLDRIQNATKHMSSLVEDLLELARIGRKPSEHQRCSLRTLAEEARAEVLRESPDRDIEWTLGDLPEVEGDPILLRQVLTNLLSNAVKFTSRQPAAAIEVASRHDNGMTVVSVRDNGAGFDPRYADKLFGVFQRLHRQDEFEGTGIGLATVQRIIHKHSGRVWAESQPGQGATFYFSLPAHAGSESKQETMGATA